MSLATRIQSITAVIIVAVFAAAGAAYAQEPTAEHLTAARNAVSATKSTNRLDNILPTLAQNAKSTLIRNRPDQEAQITLIVDEAALSLAARRGDLEVEVAKIFANAFTQDELDQISGFFATEVGQKFLAESPIVLREIDRAAQIWGNGLRRDLDSAISEKLTAAGMQ